MDARKLTLKTITEGINKGYYEVTGVLNTGEIIIALITDIDKKVLETMESKSEKEREIILKKLKKYKGRPTLEFEQVYKQKFCKTLNRCRKNNLLIRY